jgi:hypothetical protein
MVQTNEFGQIQRFCPHDCDPTELAASTVPRTEEEIQRRNRLKLKSRTMPSSEQIAWSTGTSQDKGKQLYRESVDWCAQKSSLLDRRDQEQIKRISLKVQTLARRTMMSLANKTNQIYISTRAPPCFKSCTMFETKRKVAKMAELLYFRREKKTPSGEVQIFESKTWRMCPLHRETWQQR